MKFLDSSGVAYLYKQLSLQDYPNNKTLATVINAIDETKVDKNNPIFTGQAKIVVDENEKVLATEEYVKNYFSLFGMNVYKSPSVIPLTECMQIIFYAASKGTVTLTLEGLEFSKYLASNEEVGWYLWIQTDDVSGSLISPSGTRHYMNMGTKATEALISFVPDNDSSNPAFIVITTK